MKRLFASFCIIFVFPFLIPLFAEASEVTVTYDQFNDYMKETMGYTWDLNQIVWNNIVTTFNQHPDYKLACSKMGSSSRYYVILNDNMYMSGNNIVLPQRSVAIYADSSNNSTTVNAQTLNYSGDTFFNSLDDFNSFFINIDFENVYYSPAIPLPDMNVFFLRPYITPQSGVAYWCSNLVIAPNTDYFVQYGYKITIPTLVGIGLDSTTGNYTYSYDQYNEGSYIDIVGLQDMLPCDGVSFGVNDVANAWQSAYDDIKDSIPEYYPKLPYWINNHTAPKYLEGQEYYKNYMMTILPMYGNRLEYFARLFTVVDDKVYVGDWVHWSSASGSKTQEKPTNYVDQTELPGTVNTNSNVDLPDEDNTYNSIGTPVGNQPTIINNNYAPNYPDYPTAVSYNHDNILLQFIETSKQLPSFFGDLGIFLTNSFSFIPSIIWTVIAFGFMCSIVVMIIKIL